MGTSTNRPTTVSGTRTITDATAAVAKIAIKNQARARTAQGGGAAVRKGRSSRSNEFGIYAIRLPPVGSERQLLAAQVVVQSLALDQLVVCSLLDQASAVDDDDRVFFFKQKTAYEVIW